MRTVLVSFCSVALACGGSTTAEPRFRHQSTYSLELERAVDDKAAELRADLEAGLASEQLAAKVTLSSPRGGLTITPADSGVTERIKDLVKRDYADTVEQRSCEPSVAPTSICIQLAPSYAEVIKKAALSQAVDVVRARLAALNAKNLRVADKAGQIVVEFSATKEEGARLRDNIARAAKLELTVVDDGSEYMKRLASQLQPPAGAVTAEVERWEVDGTVHTDHYLVARDTSALSGRDAIKRYVDELAAKDPSFRIPDDRQLGFGQLPWKPTDGDNPPAWRSYYLERTARLTGAAIANAEPSEEPNTRRPVVLLSFNRAGTRRFAEVTTEITGKKLATILDGTIQNAPIVMEPIRGGRVSIMMEGNDGPKMKAERDALVRILKTGALPSVLREEMRGDER